MLLTENMKKKCWISILFGVTYYLIFGLTSFASGIRHHRIVLAFPFEAHIPFYPAWSIIYMSLNVYLMLALFVFPRWQTMAAFAATLLIETIIAGCFYIILPIKLIYYPIVDTGVFAKMVFIAKFLSMNNNYFPSLHTTFAFTAAFAYSNYCSKTTSFGFYLWAGLIPLSTLFIHEHQVIDLVAGFILAVIACRYVFMPLQARHHVFLCLRRQQRLKK